MLWFIRPKKTLLADCGAVEDSRNRCILKTKGMHPGKQRTKGAKNPTKGFRVSLALILLHILV